jgi:hypothetical protein
MIRASDVDMLSYYRNSLPIEERPVTWDEIAAIDTRLTELLDEIIADPRYNDHTYDHWYEHYKPRLVRLVGHGRNELPAVMRSRSAYDVAYRTLLNAFEGYAGGA